MCISVLYNNFIIIFVYFDWILFFKHKLFSRYFFKNNFIYYYFIKYTKFYKYDKKIIANYEPKKIKKLYKQFQDI